VYHRKLAFTKFWRRLKRTLGPALRGFLSTTTPAPAKAQVPRPRPEPQGSTDPTGPHAARTRGRQSPAPLRGGSRVGGEPRGGEGLRGACALTAAPRGPPPCPARTGRADRAGLTRSMRAARQAPPPRGARAAAAGTSKPRREPAAPRGLPSPLGGRKRRGGGGEEGGGRTGGKEGLTAPAWPRTPGPPPPPARDWLPGVPPRGVGEGRGVTPRRPSPPKPPTAPAPLTTRSFVCSGSVMIAAAPAALPAVAGLAVRLPPPGAPSSSGPSSSPLLPPPLLLLQRSGRSRFLPAGPPRRRGPARAVPLPELGSSQAAPFFLGMVAGLRETHGAHNAHGAGCGAGEGTRGAAWAAPPAAPSPLPTPRATRGPPPVPRPGPKHLRARAKRGTFVGPQPGPRGPALAPSAFFFFFFFY
jgi:hypothetical protein